MPPSRELGENSFTSEGERRIGASGQRLRSCGEAAAFRVGCLVRLSDDRQRFARCDVEELGESGEEFPERAVAEVLDGRVLRALSDDIVVDAFEGVHEERVAISDAPLDCRRRAFRGARQVQNGREEVQLLLVGGPTFGKPSRHPDDAAPSQASFEGGKA